MFQIPFRIEIYQTSHFSTQATDHFNHCFGLKNNWCQLQLNGNWDQKVTKTKVGLDYFLSFNFGYKTNDLGTKEDMDEKLRYFTHNNLIKLFNVFNVKNKTSINKN